MPDAARAGYGGRLGHGDPTGTIGVDDVVGVADESDVPPALAVVDGFCPSGNTIGDGADSRLAPSPPLSVSTLGGQSTDVGGQAFADELPAPGGAQPDPAPKSPAPVQSARADGGATVSHADTVHATTPAAASNRRPDLGDIRTVLIAAGCPRRR